MIDQPRYSEWVRLSHRTATFETFMVPTIQGLGKLDAQLKFEDEAFLRLSEKERESIDVSLKLTERFTYSYLWVLGAYEIIRTMDQKCRADSSLVTKHNDVTDSKHYFERVRIPLAKFESARRYKETDSTIAYPSLNREHGIAWQVSENLFISRLELSECFINLLRGI